MSLVKSIDAIIAAYPWAPLTHEENLRQVLGFIAADDAMQDQRWVAYMLATIRHETGFTYAPVEEIGRGAGKPYGEPVNGLTYYGRGYVQITWLENYRRFGSLLGVKLAEMPQLALDPTTSYRIASEGMRLGIFTGVGLPRYINSAVCDYVNARRIINGLDQAERIAGYATQWESAL